MVLVVDDAPLHRRVSSFFLQRIGYKVQEAHSAELAMKLVQDGHFSFMLMDDLMPGLCGLQALEMMRKSESPKLQHMPVIMCTGNDQPGDRQRYMMAGADAYLAKPVTTQALEAALTQVLQCKRFLMMAPTVSFSKENSYER